MRIPLLLPAGSRSASVAALAYLALAAAWAAPSSLSPADTVPDLGDPLHLAYVMAWDAHQIPRRPWALFDSNSFYPYRASLAFSDHLLPEAIVVAPVFWATGNAVAAYNMALLIALVSSALGLFFLVRHLTGSEEAAFLAGLVYAFNSFTLHELPRVNVLNVPWWPVALLFLDRFAREGRGRDAALLAAALALQGLSGTYYLAYTVLVTPLWLGVAYLGVWRRPRATEARRLLVAVVLAAAPVLLVLRPYLAQFRSLGFEKSWAGGADALSYVLPAESWLWGSTSLGRSELPHFLGFLGLLLVAMGTAKVLALRLAPRCRPAGLLAVATGAVGLALSLGPLVHVGGSPIGPGPYGLLYRHVPIARGMASPERVGILVILAGAVLAGLALADLLSRLRRPLRFLAVAALTVLLPLEHWHPPRRGTPVPTGSAVPSVYAWLQEDSPDPMIELPLFPERARKLWAAYLYFSTYHWRPIPIGRASFYPPIHDHLAWSLRDFPDEASLALLKRLGIRTLVVHPLAWRADDRAARLAALDARTDLRPIRRFDDTVPARFAALGLGEERVYRLEGAAAATATPCSPVEEIPRETWTFASTGVNRPERVRDGSRRLAWFTARPQRPGDRLEVALAQPEDLAAVVLELDYPFDEFPRNLVLAVQEEDGRWHRVAYSDGPEERWATLQELLEHPREARLVLRIPRRRVRSIRLMVGFREEDPAWPRWAVPELRMYRECR